MIRHDYHSYRGPIYNGSRIDPDGYGVGIELETDVQRHIFDFAQTVRGVRPERDGSLDTTTGVEFIFAASDDLRTIARRFAAVKERTQFATRDRRGNYGCHVNINAANKSRNWRKLMHFSAIEGGDNCMFLRQIGRRSGYSSFAPTSSTWGYSLNSDRFSNVDISGATPGYNGQKYAVALRPNRVEFRIFKTCDRIETLLLYTLFSQAWSRWISSIEQTVTSATTVDEVRQMVSHRNFIHWVAALPASSERDAVCNIAIACAGRARYNWSGTDYLYENDYINLAGDPIREICNRLSSSQRRSRRASSVTSVESAGQAAPSLSAA